MVGVHHHGREHETEEGRREDAAPLHSVGHCECLRDGSFARDSRHHAIVELTHHLGESFGTAEFLHDLPQLFTIHHVERFRHIHEVRVGVGPHLLKLLLQLSGGEDHDGGPTMTAKAALAFRQESLFQMVVQAIEVNASEDLPGDVRQGDASMVAAELAVTFPLIEMGCL
ncbi:Peptidyl-prolyl isomerase cwc27 [Sparganum proliferum]